MSWGKVLEELLWRVLLFSCLPVFPIPPSFSRAFPPIFIYSSFDVSLQANVLHCPTHLHSYNDKPQSSDPSLDSPAISVPKTASSPLPP
jgi:hypothetical protein